MCILVILCWNAVVVDTRQANEVHLSLKLSSQRDNGNKVEVEKMCQTCVVLRSSFDLVNLSREREIKAEGKWRGKAWIHCLHKTVDSLNNARRQKGERLLLIFSQLCDCHEKRFYALTQEGYLKERNVPFTTTNHEFYCGSIQVFTVERGKARLLHEHEKQEHVLFQLYQHEKKPLKLEKSPIVNQ